MSAPTCEACYEPLFDENDERIYNCECDICGKDEPLNSFGDEPNLNALCVDCGSVYCDCTF
jgi:hypothetical protein